MADGTFSTCSDALRLSPRLPDSRLAREQEDAVLAQGDKAFRGDALLQATYRRAKELIQQYDLFLFKQVVQEPGATRLIICNLWRIEKAASGDVTLSERDLTTGDWQAVNEESMSGWPLFRLWPMAKGRGAKYWRGVCRHVIERAVGAAARQCGVPVSWRAHGRRASRLQGVCEELVIHYPGYQTFRGELHKTVWINGALHPAGMVRAARALRAAFFDNIVDKRLFSVALAIEYREMDLHRYLKLALHQEAVLRVAKERRNLLPLLPCIDSAQWHRDDLFSKRWWVRGDRRSTIIDRSSKRVESFLAPVQWRYLSKAPISVVATWVSPTGANASHEVVGTLAEANVTVKTPVAAVRTYMALVYGELRALPDHEVAVKLTRIYLQYSAKLWATDGYTAVRTWLRKAEGEANSIVDYLNFEGTARGLPLKNSTWASLLAQAKDWHERVRITAMQREEARSRAITWRSALPECEIDGYVFSPLTSAWMLANEGYGMHHCVGSYERECVGESSRIFAVRGPEEQRATLELRIRKDRCFVAQLRGAYNNTEVVASHPRMRQAAEVLAQRYFDASRQPSP